MAEATTSLKDDHIGIVGSGVIGQSWAMLYAMAGYQVRLYDIKPQQVSGAISAIGIKLKEMEGKGSLRGSLSAAQLCELITGVDSVQQCAQGAKLVQECVPEKLEFKVEIFRQLDSVVSGGTILSSSTSTMPASSFTEQLTHRSQCIVAHPVNPPMYVTLVEVVPAPWTDPQVTQTTVSLLKEIGQSPVILKKEVPGFALNRIQYALLNECWRLIKDDVVSVEDVDTVMTAGLGPRYAFIGPMETIHLNADGVDDYCERYGQVIHDISSNMGPVPHMSGDTAHKIHSDLVEKIPLDKLADRRKWRDGRLESLSRLKTELDGKDA